jgi:hypothetical protein
MKNIITVDLPHDLPENWNENQYVSPGGVEVNLTEKHGYNYLMKQVNNAQQAAQELDAGLGILAGVNLLVNPCFIDPIDRKKGYVVPPNTRYYSDTGLTASVGAVTTYVDAVYVNGVYGTIQVGDTMYYVEWESAIRGYATDGYCIDRWRKHGSGGVLIKNNHLVLQAPASTDMSLTQTLPFSVQNIRGQRVTLSVLTASGKLHTRTAVITDSTNSQVHFNLYLPDDPTTPVGAVYYNLTSEGTGHWIVITTLAGYSIPIVAVKLELGPRQTLAHQNNDGTWSLSQLPDYAAELARCSQYDVRTGAHLGMVPYGYVENSITISSAQEMDAKLDATLAGMGVGKIKFIIADFSVQHPVLGGGTRILRIDKIWDDYCVIQALGYREDKLGAVSEFFRSKLNGVWTSWARTYNTLFKPTPAEIGAAPSGFGLGETASNTATADANLITRTGFYGCNVNTPDGGWWYGEHIQYSPGNAYQKFVSTQNEVTVERWCRNGAWTPWKSLAAGTVLTATVESEEV